MTMIPSFQEKMVKAWQQARGPDPVPRRNPLKKSPETLWPIVGGTNPSPGRIPLWPMVGGTDPTLRSSPTSVDIGGRADQERCIPQWIGIRSKATRTQRTDILMAVGVQQMGGRSMAACTRYSGDDLDFKVIHLLNRKGQKDSERGTDRWLQYSVCRLWSKGRDQPLFQVSTTNG